MFRLTREVRFAVNRDGAATEHDRPTNSHGGYPSLRGFGHWLSLTVTVAGPLEAASSYLVNIKQIDAAVRQHAIPFVSDAVRGKLPLSPEQCLPEIQRRLKEQFPALRVDAVALKLSPFLCVAIRESEAPMVRLSQKFEFSATHRLHNPSLPEPENQRIYGKCNNPHGHGHNYELQVTLIGMPDKSGVLIDLPAFEQIVSSTVIDRFDHKNLNVELAEFRELVPTVENIAMTIHRLLKPKFAGAGANLASVTVWETAKTWCEYSE
jgi:6-pyruvoyltetrahydropterin/6-carboxytetrahydropterin synthase